MDSESGIRTEEEEVLECPECGFEGLNPEFEQDDEEEDEGSEWIGVLLAGLALVLAWAMDAGLLQPPV